MANTGEKLLRMEKKINEAQQQIATLNGRKEELLKQLFRDFDLKTVSQAEKFLETETKKLEKDKAKFEQKFIKLSETYNWN